MRLLPPPSTAVAAAAAAAILVATAGGVDSHNLAMASLAPIPLHRLASASLLAADDGMQATAGLKELAIQVRDALPPAAYGGFRFSSNMTNS